MTHEPPNFQPIRWCWLLSLFLYCCNDQHITKHAAPLPGWWPHPFPIAVSVAWVEDNSYHHHHACYVTAAHLHLVLLGVQMQSIQFRQQASACRLIPQMFCRSRDRGNHAVAPCAANPVHPPCIAPWPGVEPHMPWVQCQTAQTAALP